MIGSALERHAGALGVAVFLLVWELAARLIWRDPSVLPSPIQAFAQAWTVLTWPELLGHVGVSLGRTLDLLRDSGELFP